MTNTHQGKPSSLAASRFLAWFQKLFPRPRFPGSPKKTRVGAMVNDFFGAAILIGIVNLLITVPFGLYVNPATVWTVLLVVVISMAAISLIRRGHVYLVAQIGTVLLAIVGTVAIYKVGTVQALQMSAYFTAIVFASLALGPVGGGIVVTALAVVFLGFTWAEIGGHLTAAPRPSPWTQWVLFVTHGILLYLLATLIRWHMAEAVAEEQAMTGKVSELLDEVTRARESAETSSERYRSVVENVGDAIVVVQDERIVFCNPAFQRLLGLAETKILQHPFTAYIVGDDAAAIREQLFGKAAATSPSERSRFRIAGTAGTRWIEGGGVPIVWDGSPAVLTFLSDVTESKAAEELLLRAKAEAEEATEAKSRFLAAASHDLRQPLQAATLFAQALARGPLDADQQEIQRNLSGALDSMGELLESLLDISRLDSGSIVATPGPLATDHLFARIDSEFAGLAAARHLRFKLFFPQRNLTLHTDETLLFTLLRNLIGNAIKYTPDGGVLVSCRKRGRQALLQIWDTGIGIPRQHIVRIFDEYFQVGNPERDLSKGLGLGLAISRRVAGLLGATLSCRSVVGRGSVFELRLPLASRPRPTLATDTAVAPTPTDLRGCRIVLVEDNAMVAAATVTVLEGMGAAVRNHRSGEEALADPAIDDADFYITDYRLPGRNGLELLGELQQRSSRPIKAIVVTGDTTLGLASPQASGWTVLHKPIDLAHLLRAMAAQGI
jgi:PAS domain S-box-containing protein